MNTQNPTQLTVPALEQVYDALATAIDQALSLIHI